MFSASRGLLWACTALLAVATSTLHAASEDAIARNELSAQLPGGVTLAKASVDQTAGAIGLAVGKRPELGTSILAAGIIARLPKQNHGQISCEDVRKMTRAAIKSAPNQTSQLTQKAASIVPDCADSLGSLVGTDLTDRADEYSFSVGFGSNFPGSPGFTGSVPSGATAFPPTSGTTSTTPINPP